MSKNTYTDTEILNKMEKVQKVQKYPAEPFVVISSTHKPEVARKLFQDL